MSTQIYLFYRILFIGLITGFLVLQGQSGELSESLKRSDLSNVIANIMISTNINEKDAANGSTPLHRAVNYDRIDIAKYLISKGADINAADKYGDTPLAWAVSNSRSNVLAFLLDNKAQINTTNTSGQTPLHYACQHQAHFFIVEMLMNNGANLDASDKQGMRPIDYENRADVKSFLMKHNAIKRGEINEAVISHNLDKMQSLIQKDPSVVNEKSEGLVEQEFIQDKDLNKIRDIFDGETNKGRCYFIGWAPLHFAVAKGYIDIINILISKGAFIDSLDKEGYSPISMAIVGRNIEIVTLLINKGANIHHDYKPLHEAVFRNAKDIVELLINKGVNVNFLGLRNKTPLHTASQNCYDEIVDLLISRGADVNARCDRNNYTPLHWAVVGSTPSWAITNSTSEANVLKINSKFGKGVTYLEPKKYDDILDKPDLGKTRDYLRKKNVIISLIKNGANINAQDKNGRTPLNLVMFSRGGLDIAKILILNGADVNIPDNEFQMAPLHSAIMYDSHPTVELLIKNGANINAQGFCGMTPLHFAASNGKITIISLLINNGALINALDDSMRTPLEYAKSSEVLSLLQSRGAISGQGYREEKNRQRAIALDRLRQEEMLEAIRDAESASRDAEAAAQDAADASRDAENAVREAADAARDEKDKQRKAEWKAYYEMLERYPQ